MSLLACKEIICRNKALAVIDAMYELLAGADEDLKKDEDYNLSIKKSEYAISKIEPLIYKVDALE